MKNWIKSLFVLVFNVSVAVTWAQPADFDPFTSGLTKQLESDALDATTLAMKLDFSVKLCARVGGASHRDLQNEVVDWKKRNEPFLKASSDIFNSIGDRYFAAGGEPARQSYLLQRVGKTTGKDANDQVMQKLNGASLDNAVVPAERNCSDLTIFLRDRAFEIEGMRSSIRALRPYLERQKSPVLLDVVDAAITAAFQQNPHFLCLSKASSLKEVREYLKPYIKDVDMAKQDAYAAVLTAMYTAFPCPFSPFREELRTATRAEMVGTWLVPDASGKLRHSPKSPAWSVPAGLPPVRCEGIAMHDSGEYRVMQIRGKMDCPDGVQMQALRAIPRVQSWEVLQNGRVKITRTDVPAAIEEWEFYRVQKAFAFFGIQFLVGDLVSYLRREPGNELNVASTFRHLQALQN